MRFSVLPLQPSLACCHARVAQPVVALHASSPFLALSDAATEMSAGGDAGLFGALQTWQQDHLFLYGLLVTILSRYVIGELRRRIEKPVMDEVGNRVTTSVKDNLTPNQEEITSSAWAKLALCIALDIAGDASELIPILGEATDLGFAPIEAGVLKVLFKSNLIAGFGFAEEILPFTDIIPTFTLSWCLANLWPTTGLAKKLMPDAVAAKG